MDFGLAGKTVLITGASGGLGQGMARAFADEGASVFLGYYSNPAGAEALADELQKQGRRAQAAPVDVGSPESVEAFVTEAVRVFSTVDVLVNNAGAITNLTSSGIETLTMDQWDEMFRSHMTGTFLCTKAVIPFMKRGGFGRVVNISSSHALTGGRTGISNYATAKAAVISFTRATAREFGRDGVTANAILPGFIDAGMVRGLKPGMVEKICSQNPVGRLGTAKDIGDLAVFLASAQAGYITGQAICCDGGRFDYAF